jgi:hypothetical protein
VQAGRYHRAAIEEAQRDSKLWKEQTQRSLTLASEALSKSVEALEQYKRQSREVHKQALLAKELEVAVQLSEESNMERISRHAAIDEVFAISWSSLFRFCVTILLYDCSVERAVISGCVAMVPVDISVVTQFLVVQAHV